MAQPKSKPAILMPANRTPAAETRVLLRARIEPAINEENMATYDQRLMTLATSEKNDNNDTNSASTAADDEEIFLRGAS